MKRFQLVCWFCLVLGNVVFAQYDFTAVLPDLDGQNLLEKLEQDFKPNAVLPYDIARDTLFRRVYGVDNTLSCVYTSHQVPMPLGQDPTQVVFMNGANGGINTEHSWPRSYGAANGNPKSDMHHLFPTRVDVNADRGVLPFGEIPDNQTDAWYFMNTEQGNIPSSNIDQYSERSGSTFEPPEDMKGNIARAIMYFKAIYSSQSNEAPSDFFSGMQQTLCDWHYTDPVDSLEWHRSQIIATYQSGKANPFVLDCTLASRAFCPATTIACDPMVSPIRQQSALDFTVFPNPTDGKFTIQWQGPTDEAFDLLLFNSLGKLMYRAHKTSSTAHSEVDVPMELIPGMYWLQLKSKSQSKVAPIIFK